MDDVVYEALNRDPLDMTEEDLKKIISFFRGDAKAHAKGERPSKTEHIGSSLLDSLKAKGLAPSASKSTFVRRV